MAREWAYGLPTAHIATAPQRCHTGSSTTTTQTTQLTRRPTADQPRSQPPWAGQLVSNLIVVRALGRGPHGADRERDGVTGCGGFLVDLLLNPIVNASAGLPAAAGTNTAILNNTIEITTPLAREYIEEENP